MIATHNTGSAVSTFRILQPRIRNVSQNTRWKLCANYRFSVILLCIIQWWKRLFRILQLYSIFVPQNTVSQITFLMLFWCAFYSFRKIQEMFYFLTQNTAYNVAQNTVFSRDCCTKYRTLCCAKYRFSQNLLRKIQGRMLRLDCAKYSYSAKYNKPICLQYIGNFRFLRM